MTLSNAYLHPRVSSCPEKLSYDDVFYIHIYIYVCVCVCVCVWHALRNHLCFICSYVSKYFHRKPIVGSDVTDILPVCKLYLYYALSWLVSSTVSDGQYNCVIDTKPAEWGVNKWDLTGFRICSVFNTMITVTTKDANNVILPKTSELMWIHCYR